MGRPPLKRNMETVVTTIRLTADVTEQIDAIAGPNKRGAWIRDLVTRELRRLKSNPPTQPSRAKSKDAE
jgi:hypothetical protein